MHHALDRSRRRTADLRNAGSASAGTTRARGDAAKDWQEQSDTRQQQCVFTGRVALIGLGIALAWGSFLWIFIGGSIASFGNPWLYS
jgi:hypothetical protein